MFEVSKVNAWCCWNEVVCVRAPIKTQIAVFILQKSLLFPILQMYGIHRDSVNTGAVSSPAGNLTVICFFSLKGCSSLQMAPWRGFWGMALPIWTWLYLCGMWSDFFKGVSSVCAALSNTDVLGPMILCGGGDFPLHYRMFTAASMGAILTGCQQWLALSQAVEL